MAVRDITLSLMKIPTIAFGIYAAASHSRPDPRLTESKSRDLCIWAHDWQMTLNKSVKNVDPADSFGCQYCLLRQVSSHLQQNVSTCPSNFSISTVGKQNTSQDVAGCIKIMFCLTCGLGVRDVYGPITLDFQRVLNFGLTTVLDSFILYEFAFGSCHLWTHCLSVWITILSPPLALLYVPQTAGLDSVGGVLQ